MKQSTSFGSRSPAGRQTSAVFRTRSPLLSPSLRFAQFPGESPPPHLGPAPRVDGDNEPSPRPSCSIFRGKVEILGGGFYEPILPALPSATRSGDTMISAGPRSASGRSRPHVSRERVWDRNLPRFCGRPLRSVLDARLPPRSLRQEMRGTFLTEREADAVGVYPIDKNSATSPVIAAGEVIEYLLCARAPSEGGRSGGTTRTRREVRLGPDRSSVSTTTASADSSSCSRPRGGAHKRSASHFSRARRRAVCISLRFQTR